MKHEQDSWFPLFTINVFNASKDARSTQFPLKRLFFSSASCVSFCLHTVYYNLSSFSVSMGCGFCNPDRFHRSVWSNLHVWLGEKLQSCCCCCWIDFKPHLCKLIDKSNIPRHKYDVRTFSCLPGQRFFASFCPSGSVLYSPYCSHFITCSTSGIVVCLLCTRPQMDFHPSPNINDPKKTGFYWQFPAFPSCTCMAHCL